MDRTNKIGEKIQSLRTIKEISREELADRTGLSIEQIARIEENIDIPSLAPLIKIARALGWEPSWTTNRKKPEQLSAAKVTQMIPSVFRIMPQIPACICAIILCRATRQTATWSLSSST